MRPLVYVLTTLALTGSLNLGWSNFLSRVSELSRQSRELEGAQTRQRELEVRSKELLARVQSKERVAQEVIAGHLALRDGITRFRAFCLSSPDLKMGRFDRLYPGAPEEECFGRDLIAEVAAQLADQPNQAREVTRRLEAELEALLGRGVPRLPG